MTLSRNAFGTMALSSIAASTLPAGRVSAATLGEIDPPSDADDRHVKIERSTGAKKISNFKRSHHDRTTKPYLSTAYDHMGFGKFSRPDAAGNQAFPANGTMSFIIDYKGNYAFSASFPSFKNGGVLSNGEVNPLGDVAVAVGIALESSIGRAIGIVAHGRVRTFDHGGTGWNDTKNGHSAIVADLWKDVVRGASFVGTWHAVQIPVSQPNASADEAQVAADAQNALASAVGIVATIISFL